jgi:hypothetical protein
LEDYENKGWALVSNGPYVTIKVPVERALAFVQFIEDKSAELLSHGA